MTETEIVIVLEDSIPNQGVLKHIVEKLGYGVLAGESGLRGLELIERCQRENMHLVAIISEVVLPGMGGLKFLETVKSKKMSQHLPFVFMTADASKESILEAKRLGVTSYILKPVTIDKIRDVLQVIFPNRVFPPLNIFSDKNSNF